MDKQSCREACLPLLIFFFHLKIPWQASGILKVTAGTSHISKICLCSNFNPYFSKALALHKISQNVLVHIKKPKQKMLAMCSINCSSLCKALPSSCLEIILLSSGNVRHSGFHLTVETYVYRLIINPIGSPILTCLEQAGHSGLRCILYMLGGGWRPPWDKEIFRSFLCVMPQPSLWGYLDLRQIFSWHKYEQSVSDCKTWEWRLGFCVCCHSQFCPLLDPVCLLLHPFCRKTPLPIPRKPSLNCLHTLLHPTQMYPIRPALGLVWPFTAW